MHIILGNKIEKRVLLDEKTIKPCGMAIPSRADCSHKPKKKQ